MAIIAISPFHVLYAQEARPYSLWTVLILLSSAALLRTMRLQTTLGWATYGITAVLGLYCYLYFWLVTIGHAIYSITIEGFQLSKTFRSYLLVSLAGVLVFALWPLAVVINRPSLHHVSGFWNNSVSRLHLLNRWSTNFSRIFLDFGFGYPHSLKQAIPQSLVTLSVLLLIGYAIYFLWRQTPIQTWLFVLTLIGVQGIALMLPDLILGRWRLSGEARYLIPSYLGIQLAVAYLLSSKLTSIFVNFWQQKLWQLVTILVISAGVVSCVFSSQAEVWWNKGYSQYDPEVASLINKASQPLVLSDDSPNVVIALSYLLNPKVIFQLVVTPNIPKIPESFSEVFLYRASETLRSGIEKEHNYKVEPAQKNRELGLWKLTKV